ncbi:MAG: LysM peptidoglycan-binding domain-containing protein [Actinomycetota bacterium]|nr:LysM peptidoglycan-binding domain-containing protein [Actinomycetota bacterium]
MSAALAWDVESLGGLEAPIVHGRPRLQLVPTGSEVVAPALVPVRMTRAGRLVRTVVVTSIALAITWTLLGALSAAAAGHHIATVVPGQTLSQIAARELPALPIREGVAQIQLANGLSSSEIHAGQVLQIPPIG